MDKITAPYRFIDYSTEIFYPSWGNYQGDDIRFDMPYKDSKSGEITLKLIAKSPIFIGDFKSEDSNGAREFFNHNGVYYIPGSSLKGMIRTIAAILSFSKMSIGDKTLSYRDINNESYKQKAMNQSKIFMGWLYQESKQWYIGEIGNVTKTNCRIKYEDMKQYLEPNLVEKIKDPRKAAYQKYEIIKDLEKLKIKKGTIVFTGMRKKRGEFIFSDTIVCEHTLSKEQIATFKEAYGIETPNESKDWKQQWSKRFDEEKRVPIFFQKDSNNTIMHFGLSMFYKLPYENSIATLYKNSLTNYNEKFLDCVERIFGFVKEKSALKGRVSFSHLKAQNPKELNAVSLVLSSPRPTFYPFYLQQKPNARFKNYDNKDAKLSGFKFYVPRETIMQNKNASTNTNIESKIKPLQAGTEFIGKIRYFNLRKEELGLLLLSLTFLKNEHFYKIGGAKPYGYGDCHIELSTTLDIQALIASYVDFVKAEFKQDPSDSISAKDLLRYSKRTSNQNLRYLDLKEFAKIKRDNHSKFSKPKGKKHNKSKSEFKNNRDFNNSLADFFKE